MNESTVKSELIVIGASSGGLEAMGRIIEMLPKDFTLPVILIQHLPSDAQIENFLSVIMRHTQLPVLEASWGTPILPGQIYLAPPNYHLLIEENRTFALDSGERRNHARPSIDILFESAADCFGSTLIGVVLSGANADGAQGLKQVRKKGGIAIVQDPQFAHAPQMPTAAIEVAGADQVMRVEEIGSLLVAMEKKGKEV